MKTMTWLSLPFALLLAGSSRLEKNNVPPAGQTCDNEHLLETYQDREAMMVQSADNY